MSCHTPGPWFAASHPSGIVGWPVIGAHGRAVASVHLLKGDTELGKQINAEAGANARLIAAAPELLSILHRYMAAYPAFRIKPEGAPNSPVRIEQERLMALEDMAQAIINKLTPAQNSAEPTQP